MLRLLEGEISSPTETSACLSLFCFFVFLFFLFFCFFCFFVLFLFLHFVLLVESSYCSLEFGFVFEKREEEFI